MTIPLKQLGVYISLLFIGGGVGFVGHQYLLSGRPRAVTPTPEVVPAAVQPLSITPSPAANPNPANINFIAEAVQKVGPAVVRIDAMRSTASQSVDSFGDSPFFRRFFGNDVPEPRTPVERGTGSGFILSSDGRLITNAHVVEGSDLVRVTLKDGRILEGRVIGADNVTDIAVVKIEAENLPTVQLGNSETLIPGEWAIAIGNPLGLDNTVTVGIISALDRSSSQVGVPDKRVRFIQTDAAINPGNSGGPLLNAQGEVIGMNTAIRANAQGLGFAIPVETAQRIANQLFSKGKADHPYLGIQMITLNAERRKEINENSKNTFNVSVDEGVVIMEVIQNSPAAQAGFQAGDVILQVGGVAVATAVDVQQQVERSVIGQPLAVTILRQRRTMQLQVTPGVFPD
ncbi:trypsin-like peptidase domain-containing protein [Spirulina subsalsa FACHB-351]|uniref:Trypsin-like peptidase domain-containing protein n=1 Tax=Spirulina subsalsa FACHB-351 TaxID=234711 RepID=A0ABT3L4G6_9CYAN|nr:HhoA/HhoB/HtrA family serine endopeptidase [Spirulina subsalsa]MCW6036394.1 trypsin-like peptidase domain-containing protein [Spirulina subsalsa FACHB-351]